MSFLTPGGSGESMDPHPGAKAIGTPSPPANRPPLARRRLRTVLLAAGLLAGLLQPPAHAASATLTATGTIPTQSLETGGATRSLDVTGYFSDMAVTYAARSSDEGVVTVSVSNGSAVLTPVDAGAARVMLTACDGASTATHVIAVKVAPTALEAADGTLAGLAGTIQALDLATLTSGGDGPGYLRYSVTQPSVGSVMLEDGGSVATFTPPPSFSTETSFTYTVADDYTSDSGTVTVTPRTGNQAPTATGRTIPALTLTPNERVYLDLAEHFSDPEDVLSYKATSSDTAVVTASVAGSGAILAAVGVGAAVVKVTASDGLLTSEPKTVEVIVVSLTPSAVTASTATLTLGGWQDAWHYRHTAPASGSCSAVQSGAEAELTSLESNTAYTFAAYSDSGCATKLVVADLLTLPGKLHQAGRLARRQRPATCGRVRQRDGRPHQVAVRP